MGMKKLLLTGSCVLFTTLLIAQSLPFLIKVIDKEDIPPVEGVTDSLGFLNKVIDFKNELMKKGYLLANVDRHICRTDSCLAYLYSGKKISWGYIYPVGFPSKLLKKLNLGSFNQHPIKIDDFQSFMSGILDYSGRTGSPYAVVRMDSVIIRDEGISGQIRYTQGPLVTYDTLSIYGDQDVNRAFLQTYLDLDVGEAFNRRSIEGIDGRITRLDYLSLDQPPRYILEGTHCKVNLDLRSVKANKLDALIGFLPKQGSNSGLRLTGFVDLDLQNLFHSGKRLTFLWRQFNVSSQELNVVYDHPVFLRSPLGIKFDLHLLKQDTSFINRDIHLTAQLQKIKVNYSLTVDLGSSRLIKPSLVTTDSLFLSDYNSQYLGAGFGFEDLDNKDNPSRGWRFSLLSELGKKSILHNSSLPPEVYDSLNLNPVQIKFEGTVEYNQRIRGPFVGHLDIGASRIHSSGKLFLNDLYRLGGIHSVRGFNDLERFASSYFMIRSEVRMLFNQDSRLFVFYDLAFTDNVVSHFTDRLTGIGAGLVLNTGPGRLQLVYALGNSNQQSLSLAQAKIHIGYIAKF